MRAVDAVMECLKAEGVDVVFGLPGGANLDLRRLRRRRHPPRSRPPRGRRRPRRRGLREGDRQRRRLARHVRPRRDQPRHADRRRDDGLGPGRLHHRPGPHRPARHRRLPGGRHDRHHDAGRQALVHDPDPLEIPRAIHEAFHVARSGRPGPVVVDIPTTSRGRTSRTSRSTDVHLPGYQPTTEGNAKQIRQAAKALAAARRPVIYAGGGVVNAERVGGAARARARRTASRSPAR